MTAKTMQIKIAVAQIDFRVGDIAGNVDKILAARERHKDADLVITSECSVTGYPLEDLVFRPSVVREAKRGLERLCQASKDGGPALIVGAPWTVDGAVRNSAFLIDSGVMARTDKRLLPNTGVFDEKRVFAPGPSPEPFRFRGFDLALLVCEDVWGDEPAEAIAAFGADLLIAINGSPFEAGKDAIRKAHMAKRAVRIGCDAIYVNQVGGQDELVFDGASFALTREGRAIGQMPAFAEAEARLVLARGPLGARLTRVAGWDAPYPESLEATYRALVIGLRDYVAKNGFPGVLLGLSGGIDSALTAAIAVDALGPERVRTLMMPYLFTSSESVAQAQACAEALGIRHDTAAIHAVVDALASAVHTAVREWPEGLAKENAQARTRGMLLMTVSNMTGWLVLSTGNKSEISVGYATLYGDMCGGYSVLKDVYKTEVFALARWRNAHRPDGLMGPAGIVVPEATIERPPSAELAPGQKDEDSLPPYETLDAILRLMVDGWKDDAAIIVAGHAPETVARVRKLLDRAEYKRRQGAPGVKVGGMAFGRDRRVPITNGYVETVAPRETPRRMAG